MSFLKRRTESGTGPDIDRMFRLQVDDAGDKYRRMQADLQKGCDTVMSFKYTDEDGRIYGGRATDHHDGTALISISCMEMMRPASGPFPFRSQMFVPGKAVVRNTISAWHERVHAMQFAEARLRGSDPYLAMRLLCNRKNQVLYNGDGHLQNYWHDMTELPAEKGGIIGAPAALHKMFPALSARDCELAVLDYIDSRCFLYKDGKRHEQADYFIKLPLDWDMNKSSVKKIGEVFDEAIKNGKSFAPKYQLTFLHPWGDEMFQADDFCRTVDRIDRSSPWSKAYDKLESAATENEALTILASVALMNYPDGWKEYPTLERVRTELDPDVVFGSGFLDEVARYDEARGTEPPYLSVRKQIELRNARSLPESGQSVAALADDDREFGD